MVYTIVFSTKQNNKNVPYTVDGIEAQLRVESDTKTGAIYHAETVAYCSANNTSVRGVSP